MFKSISLSLLFSLSLTLSAQRHYTAVSYNCENLFDVHHDTLKHDVDFLPDGERHWTFSRYRQKLNDIGKTIVQCGGEGTDWSLPDLVALMEVENDSVLHDLVYHSMLRGAYYRYTMTCSPDVRGIDVALLYNPFRIQLLHSEQIVIPPMPQQRPTRNILHATLRTALGDTLHTFIVHAPSRSGGAALTEPYRLLVCDRLLSKIDSLRTTSVMPHILIMGDFNDYSYNKSIKNIVSAGFTEISSHAVGKFHPDDVLGTYCYQHHWESLDHIFISPNIVFLRCFIHDAPWLLESDEAGHMHPRRTFLGPHYHGGVSDHLPLVLHFLFQEK